MHLGGVAVCLAMTAALTAAVSMAPGNAVTGPLTPADKLGVYTAVLDERTATAGPSSTPRFLVDARNELRTEQRNEIVLRYPATWLGPRELEAHVGAETGSETIDVLYPAVVRNGTVTVAIGELCGHFCSTGTTYELTRAGTGWRVLSSESAVGVGVG